METRQSQRDTDSELMEPTAGSVLKHGLDEIAFHNG